VKEAAAATRAIVRVCAAAAARHADAAVVRAALDDAGMCGADAWRTVRRLAAQRHASEVLGVLRSLVGALCGAVYGRKHAVHRAGRHAVHHALLLAIPTSGSPSPMDSTGGELGAGGPRGAFMVWGCELEAAGVA